MINKKQSINTISQIILVISEWFSQTKNKDGCIQPFNEESCGATPVFPGGAELYSEIIQENHYYPFGMQMDGAWDLRIDLPENQYKYNGKELNKDFGLNWLDYGVRWYDPAVARWNAVDPLADKFTAMGPCT